MRSSDWLLRLRLHAKMHRLLLKLCRFHAMLNKFHVNVHKITLIQPSFLLTLIRMLQGQNVVIPLRMQLCVCLKI